MAEFEKCLKIIFQHEGTSFSNHREDRGKATKFGITQATLSSYRGSPVTSEDVERLTIEEAQRIYRERYWDRLGLDQVAGFKKSLVIFDQGVNSGTMTSAKRTQSTLNFIDSEFKLTVDGNIGPKTIKAINEVDDLEFCLEFIFRSMHYYIDICKANSSQIAFISGWMNRAQNLLRQVVLS